MDDEIRLDEPLPHTVIAGIRALYEPPQEPGYWSALERRIRERVAADGAPAQWWQVIGRWGRTGIVAAAAVLVFAIVGALLLHARADELRTAYESATQPVPAESVTVPAGALSERDGPDQRGATFRDVISP